MSKQWMTIEELKRDRDRYKPVREMLEDGCEFVMCMVRGHSKYDPDYRLAVVVSESDYKYKCSNGYTWDSAYAVDWFGEPLTVYEYNRIRSQV
tara:strand:- start:31 stop:309 length:279 start_codon:yes stop_codon:yes gene_type:complete